jgi:lipoprotein-releasing system permease protein
MTAARGRLRLALDIAARWWRGRTARGRGFRLSGTARAAFFSAALGTLAMTIAMALLTGYRETLVDRLVGANAAVVVYPLASEGVGWLPDGQLERLAALPGVGGVERVAFGQGTIASGAGRTQVVTMRGGEPGRAVLGAGTPVLAARQDPAVPEVVLGDELARALGVAPGDVVRWTALATSDGRPRFAYQSLRVASTFHVGFSEFDRGWAVTERAVVLARAAGGRMADSADPAAGLIEVRLADAERAEEVAQEVRRVVGDSYLVSDWRSLNERLFGALRLQQRMLFLVLGLIVVVSTFHVASTLIVAARERTREVGILRALGFAPGDVRRTFLVHGIALGWTGAAAGIVAGVVVAIVLDRTRAIRFDAGVAAIYFLDAVPFHVRWADLGRIFGFAATVHAVACWLPTRRAARIDPAVALRDE